MSGPKAGDFLDGYYFAGGDPAKKENWMAPPSVGTVQDGYEYVGGFPGDKNNWKPKKQERGAFDFDAKTFGQNVKENLPVYGAMAGGMLGATVGGPVGGVVGAGAGGYLGRAGQNIMKTLQGEPVTRKELYGGPVESAVEGAGAEAAGGLLGKGLGVTAKTIGKSIKKTASSAANVPEKAMDIYLARAKDVDKLINKYENIQEAAPEFKKNLVNELRSVRQEASTALGQALKNEKYSMQTKLSSQPLKDVLLNAQKNINKVTRPADYAQIEMLISRLDELAPSGEMPVSALHDFKEMAWDIAKGSFQKEGDITKSGGYVKSVAKQIGGKSARMINDVAPELKKANETLSKLHKIEQNLPSSVLDPKASSARLSGIAKGTQPEDAKTLMQAGGLVGRPNILEDVENIFAAQTYANPDVLSGAYTGRSLLSTALGAGAGEYFGETGIGAGLGAAFGSPLAQKQAIRMLSRGQPLLQSAKPTLGLLGEAPLRYFMQKQGQGLLGE